MNDAARIKLLAKKNNIEVEGNLDFGPTDPGFVKKNTLTIWLVDLDGDLFMNLVGDLDGDFWGGGWLVDLDGYWMGDFNRNLLGIGMDY